MVSGGYWRYRFYWFLLVSIECWWFQMVSGFICCYWSILVSILCSRRLMVSGGLVFMCFY